MNLNKLLKTGRSLSSLGAHFIDRAAANSLPNHPDGQPMQPQDSAASPPPSASHQGMKNNLMRQAAFKGKEYLAGRRSRKINQPRQVLPLRLTSIGTGRVVDLRELRQPAVLFISHKENAMAAAELNRSLLFHFLPDPLPIFTANIILLNDVPVLAHAAARRELLKAYETVKNQWLKGVPNAAEIINLLPDWNAETVASLHLSNRRPMLASVILSAHGSLECVLETATPLPEILAHLRQNLSI